MATFDQHYDINSPYDSDPDTFLKPMLAKSEISSSGIDTSADWLLERSTFLNLSRTDLPSDGGNVEGFLKSH